LASVLETPVLEIERLVAGYGELRIVRDFSCALEAGTVTTLVGGNGAGKSTLMRAIYGTCRQFAGAIRLAGDDISRLAPWERLARGIGFVPQGRCNFATMSVAENFKMACYTLPSAKHDAAIARVLELFPAIKGKLGVIAGNLSGGEQQMLETAMVMVLEPRLLLLDEPSLGLSPKMQSEVFAMARSLAAGGVTVLMVEQNVHGALAVSDRARARPQVHGRPRARGAARSAHPPRLPRW
jgi:branched-chain amino acid transport system ATP-binding protein